MLRVCVASTTETRAHEEQSLEHGVVEGVIEAGDQSKRGQIRLAQRAKHQRRAEADEDDADIFDAVPCEQSLEVVLHQRVEDSQQSRRHAQRQHHGPIHSGGAP